MQLEIDQTSLLPLEPLLVDAKRCAELLSVSFSLFRKLVRTGKTPLPTRLGKCVRWSLHELRYWVRAGCPTREVWITIREKYLNGDG